MQESHSHATSPNDTQTAALHSDIELRASELWQQYGQPVGRDFEIWLEAEQQLFSAKQAPHEEIGSLAPMPTRAPAKAKRR
jgi:hypothetical protein